MNMIRVYLHDADFTLLRSLNYFLFLFIHIIERFLKLRKIQKICEISRFNFVRNFVLKKNQVE